MRCRRIREQLDAYLAGAPHGLPMPDRNRVDAHLAGCAACRRERSRRRALGELLAAAPVPPVPEGFSGRVLARAKALPRGAEPRQAALPGFGAHAWRRVRLLAGAASALAAGLALGAFLGNDVWRASSAHPQPAEVRQADVLSGAGFGRLVVDYDDSLAQAYLELTARRDG